MSTVYYVVFIAIGICSVTFGIICLHLKYKLMSCILFGVSICCIFMCIQTNRVDNLITEKYQVTATVVSKEYSITTDTDYDYAYSTFTKKIKTCYYVTIECEIEETIISGAFETFNDDLYQTLQIGDKLQVIVVVRKYKNGKIYDTSIYQFFDEE